MANPAEDLLAQAQRIIAKAWADEGFKAALLADPKATLAAEGIPLPEALTLKVLENTADTLHVILPPPPAAALSDEAVGAVAGGAGVYNVCFGSSVIPTSQNFTIASLYCANVPTDLPNLAPETCQAP